MNYKLNRNIEPFKTMESFVYGLL